MYFKTLIYKTHNIITKSSFVKFFSIILIKNNKNFSVPIKSKIKLKSNYTFKHYIHLK